MNTRALVATVVGAVTIAIAIITWKNIAAASAAAATLAQTKTSSVQFESHVKELQQRRASAELVAARIEASWKAGGLAPMSTTTPGTAATPVQRRSGTIAELIRDEPDAQVRVITGFHF